jgi:hypothetical protein
MGSDWLRRATPSPPHATLAARQTMTSEAITRTQEVTHA